MVRPMRCGLLALVILVAIAAGCSDWNEGDEITVEVGDGPSLRISSIDNTFRATRPDESTWTMDGDKVVVTLAKMDEQVWHELLGLPNE